MGCEVGLGEEEVDEKFFKCVFVYNMFMVFNYDGCGVVLIIGG